jgi:succinate dehydrogenase/fumarate reductase flavoprotein subunit
VSDKHFDVVVLGAGLGGLVAALAAAEDGASVLCLEKAPEPGGSFALSGGYIWTVPTVDDYERIVPEGHSTLGRALVEDFDDSVDWLIEHGVTLAERGSGYGPDHIGEGYRVRPDTISGGIEPLCRAITAAGGRLITHIKNPTVERDEFGRPDAVSYTSGTQRTRVRCSAVVIATGGFQGDVELLCRYVSPWADRAYLRSNPASTGDGLRIALGCGAGVSRGLRAFYGHLLPAPPAHIEPGAFRGLSQFYSAECILVNVIGERFVDESRGDAMCTLATASQPEATAFIVFDADRWTDVVSEPYLHDAVKSDPLKVVEDAGGRVFRAETLAELAAQLHSRYRVPAARFERTISTFDAAAIQGVPRQLDVPRTSGLHTCRVAPFFAVPVRPGITFTEGGIAVDETCQVLDRAGEVINGLFAAGADVGGISNEGYVGGLGAALVTGLRAGIFAAREAERVTPEAGTAS